MIKHHQLHNQSSIYTQLAEHIVQEGSVAHTICLIPNDFLIYDMTQALVHSNYEGLLPTITTLRQWVDTHSAPPVLTPHHALLILADVLEQHRHLYGQGNAWGLASNLFGLFNELTLSGHSPETSWDDFEQQVQPHAHTFDWLNKEAKMVHTLWQAWHAQMQEEQWQDNSTAYAQQLAQHAKQTHSYQRIVYVSPFKPSRCEQQWLDAQASRCHVSVIKHHTPPTPNRMRAIVECSSLEQHAYAVASNAERACKANVNTLIVAEDRKLSRRIQALLNRQGIQVDDKSGWALSTTSIGACIEHWLRCIESDFAHTHLLDTLKSHCVNIEHALETFGYAQSECVFRLEQDVVRHENISSQLTRYQRALSRRLERLEIGESKPYKAVSAMLEHCGQSAEPLLHLYKSKSEHPIHEFIDALFESLNHMGITQAITDDDAGDVVIKLLNDTRELSLANKSILPNTTWPSFRAWLNQALEKTYFRPPIDAQNTSGYVTMVTYAQAYFMEAGFYILCGVDDTTLPQRTPAMPFFSYRAQLDLGLEAKAEFEQRHKQVFLRLLHSHTPCLLTWQSQYDDTHVGLCNWLLHEQSEHGLTLQTEQHTTTNMVDCILPRSLPTLPPYSKPKLNNLHKVLPSTISASAHQKLINSPYDYFISYMLGLRSEESVSDALKKSDYGSRVHRCLELFHTRVLAGEYEFSFPLNNANKTRAQALLQSIGKDVFFHDVTHYFENKAWYELWLSAIPIYVNWEIKNQTQWQPKHMEKVVNYALNEHVHIKGIIDRVDASNEHDGMALVDYKTGLLPSKKDMNNGENVQLATYAITEPNTTQLTYLKINSKEEKSIQTENDLNDTDIIHRVCERLEQLHESLKKGEAITSHCDHPGQSCWHKGICRCDYWVD